MKNNECNVVHDLIPLVIDRVASDESRELVETHISACENCRKKYEAMKADLPEAVRTEYECEQQKFVDALRNVRKKRLKRRILSICLAALICMVAAFGGLFAYDRLFHQHTVAVDNSLYSLSLSRLKDGSIVITADQFGISFNTSTYANEQLENGKYICYMYFAAAPIHWNDNYVDPNRRTKDEMFVLHSDDSQPVHEIRQGTPEDYVTVWTEGEPIADASEQMERYFALNERWMVWWNSLPATDDGKVFVEDAENYAWQDIKDQAWHAVPEWQ